MEAVVKRGRAVAPVETEAAGESGSDTTGVSGCSNVAASSGLSSHEYYDFEYHDT